MSEKEVNREFSRDIHKEKQRAYLISSAVNLILPPLKLVGGIYGHSSALIADAVNSLSDIVANAIVFLFLRVSSKPRDQHHSYGHGKYETIATLFIAIMMLLAGLIIIAQSVSTIIDYFQEGILPATPAFAAIVIALFTMVSKELVYRYTRQKAHATHSEALMAQAIDHRNDVFSALAVLIGVMGAKFLGGIGKLLEPVAAIMVACFILRAGVKLAQEALLKLTDGTVPESVVAEIKQMISEIPGVEDPHNFRTRMIGSDIMAIELDIRLDGNMSLFEAHDKTIDIEDAVRERYGRDTHIIVHMEPKLPYLHVSSRKKPTAE